MVVVVLVVAVVIVRVAVAVVVVVVVVTCSRVCEGRSASMSSSPYLLRAKCFISPYVFQS